MKILHLRLKNLNSLYGECSIDFTSPEYVSSGIFALTGPTGSGKSTILDAVCLALYGSTPRLGRITQSGNEIMSRGTGECFAEVLFESQAGMYRCFWGQHRAHGKPDAELQQPRHEIAEGVEGGRVIENQLRKVQAAVEEKTGMDFGRFTRSVLLAQGEFDSFLNAQAEDKSRILEQITGTQIYTEISVAVHERQRAEREKLKILNAEVSGIEVLELEAEKAILSELSEKNALEKDRFRLSKELGTAILWLKNVSSLERELDSLTEEKASLESEIAAFIPRRNMLEQAIAAAVFDGEYAALTGARDQMKSRRDELVSTEDKLPGAQSLIEETGDRLEKARENSLAAIDDLEKNSPIILRVRKLDDRTADRKRSLQLLEGRYKEDVKLIEEDHGREATFSRRIHEIEKELVSIGKYFESHSADQFLVSGLAGIEEKLSTLKSKKTDMEEKEASIKETEDALGVARAFHGKQKEKLSSSLIALKETADAVRRSQEDLNQLLDKRLLREYRAEKESLLREKALLDRVASLEDQRNLLEDGKQCPLCGALDHPYAEGNAPLPDETERKILVLNKLISKAEDIEAEISRLDSAEKETQKTVSKIEKKDAEYKGSVQTAEAILTGLRKDSDKLHSDYSTLKKTVLESLSILGVEDLADEDAGSLLQSLRKRLEEWRNRESRQSQLVIDKTQFEGEQQRLAGVLSARVIAATEAEKQLEGSRSEYEDLCSERLELFGEMDPDVEEKRFRKAVADSEKAEKQAKLELEEIRGSLSILQNTAASLREKISEREPAVEATETEFLSMIQAQGFTDEIQFMEARIAPQERNALQQEAKDLDHRATDLAARQKDREERLAAELEKAVTDKKLDELEPLHAELLESLEEIREEILHNKRTLADNRAARDRIASRQSLILAQKRECDRWNKLHGLIGSSDGKKYRNFAQGITFELMVSHANVQLQNMTDRYLLTRDAEKPLELNVIDNWQAGEVRSVKNLSGGESFIVSLSLALGLSRMASRKVKVDSLFLDEGFGTLDADALETALETLASLQQDGKLIGIISHIAALKERIGTQINVSRISGGKSRFTGPGCTHVS